MCTLSLMIWTCLSPWAAHPSVLAELAVPPAVFAARLRHYLGQCTSPLPPYPRCESLERLLIGHILIFSLVEALRQWLGRRRERPVLGQGDQPLLLCRPEEVEEPPYVVILYKRDVAAFRVIVRLDCRHVPRVVSPGESSKHAIKPLPRLIAG